MEGIKRLKKQKNKDRHHLHLCGHPFMLLKKSKKGKEYIECPECKFRKKA